MINSRQCATRLSSMDEENSSLKTGYLLKFEPNKKWKMRWVVLHENELTCHHRRDKTVVVNVVPLTGSSVVCPCLDDPCHIQGVLKIILPEGEELYFQAAGRQDRDGWAHAIGAVIRSLTGSKQAKGASVAVFPPFRVYANVSEILGAMQEPDAGVELGNHVRNHAVHKNCFKGSDVVDWLVRWSIVRKREAGAAMVQMLLKLGHVQEVDINDGSAGASIKFSDGDRLYRFTSLNLGSKRNSYYDSTDSDSDESSGEDEDDTQADGKLKKGKIIKERFLLKRRNIAKDWRIVKVILRDNPPAIEYCRAIQPTITSTKDGVLPATKVIDMEMYQIQDQRKTSGASTQSDSKGKVKKKLCLKDRNGKGRCHMFKTKDEEEWYEWSSLLHQIEK